MVVLSLFDGISTGCLALQRAGIPIDCYYSSEIDKYAIAVSQKNFPDIVRLGSVEDWKNWKLDWSKIDLLIGGSPCQGFSFAGKQLNFNDPRSKLFFVYADILKKIKEENPKVKFLLENVKMKKEYQNTISSYLGVEPIEINSELVSAQRRRRLYWTNIEHVTQPEDKKILLKDIVLENSDYKYACSQGWLRWFDQNKEKLLKKSYIAINPDKALTMVARQYANWQGTFWFEKLKSYTIPPDRVITILDNEVERHKVGFLGTKEHQTDRIYSIHDKAITLSANGGGRGGRTGLYLFGCLNPTKRKSHQSGNRFNDGKKFYTLTVADCHGILTDGYIRKLTPLECERLQTLPENFTQGELNGKPISDNQRYKMLGNGWTCDVVAHILSFLKK